MAYRPISDSEVELIQTGYGKNYVRLLHVSRQGRVHHVRELEVNTELELSSPDCYITGDNRDVVATDSQKNTVYSLAKLHGIKSIENFATLLCNHFLSKYGHVKRSKIQIRENCWERHNVDGKAHGHMFISSSKEGVRTCKVERKRGADPTVTSGIADLTIMKTTQSAFVNFVRDEFRSLPDMSDRIFCTKLNAYWSYKDTTLIDYDWAWDTVKSCIMEAMSGDPQTGVFSPSVQYTLYVAQKMALTKIAQMDWIHIAMPNIHHYPFNFDALPALGVKDNDEVFIPSDKPSGNITGTLRRKDVQAKL